MAGETLKQSVTWLASDVVEPASAAAREKAASAAAAAKERAASAAAAAKEKAASAAAAVVPRELSASNITAAALSADPKHKPSVLRMWQTFMELFNDVARRHGLIRCLPLDPIGLFFLVRTHRNVLSQQCQHTLQTATVLSRRELQPSDDAGSVGMPLYKGGIIGDTLSMQANITGTPAHGYDGPGVGDRSLDGLGVPDIQGDWLGPPSGKPPPRSNWMSLLSTLSGSSEAEVCTCAAYGSGAHHDPHCQAGSGHVASSASSRAMHRSISGDAIMQGRQGLSGQHGVNRAAAAAATRGKEPGTTNQWSDTWQQQQQQQRHPLHTLDNNLPISAAAAALLQDPSSKSFKPAAGSGPGSKPQAKFRSEGSIPECPPPPMPHAVHHHHHALMPTVLQAMHFSRAAYGYVMASGRLTSLTSFLTIVATSAYFEPVSNEMNNRAICEMTGIPPEDILMAEWNNTTFRPCHYVAVDRERQQLVLAIRGSLQLGDLVTDLTATPMELEFDGGHGGAVHRGLMSAAAYVHYSTAEVLMRAAEKYPGWPLLLTGHSLGAGVASLLVLLMRQPGCAPPQLGPIHCVGIGSPACMSSELAESCRPFLTSVINNADFVARLSCVTVEGVLLGAVSSSPAMSIAGAVMDGIAAGWSMIRPPAGGLGGEGGALSPLAEVGSAEQAKMDLGSRPNSLSEVELVTMRSIGQVAEEFMRCFDDGVDPRQTGSGQPGTRDELAVGGSGSSSSRRKSAAGDDAARLTTTPSRQPSRSSVTSASSTRSVRITSHALPDEMIEVSSCEALAMLDAAGDEAGLAHLARTSSSGRPEGVLHPSLAARSRTPRISLSGSASHEGEHPPSDPHHASPYASPSAPPLLPVAGTSNHVDNGAGLPEPKRVCAAPGTPHTGHEARHKATPSPPSWPSQRRVNPRTVNMIVPPGELESTDPPPAPVTNLPTIKAAARITQQLMAAGTCRHSWKGSMPHLYPPGRILWILYDDHNHSDRAVPDGHGRMQTDFEYPLHGGGGGLNGSYVDLQDDTDMFASDSVEVTPMLEPRHEHRQEEQPVSGSSLGANTSGDEAETAAAADASWQARESSTQDGAAAPLLAPASGPSQQVPAPSSEPGSNKWKPDPRSVPLRPMGVGVGVGMTPEGRVLSPVEGFEPLDFPDLPPQPAHQVQEHQGGRRSTSYARNPGRVAMDMTLPTTSLTGSLTQGMFDGLRRVASALCLGAVPSVRQHREAPRRYAVLLEPDRKTFEQLLLTPTCVGDHIPDAYLQALTRLVGPTPKPEVKKPEARRSGGGLHASVVKESLRGSGWTERDTPAPPMASSVPKTSTSDFFRFWKVL